MSTAGAGSFWRRLMTRAGLCALAAALVLLSVQVRAETLTTRPRPGGGDPTGIWEADSTPLGVYLSPGFVDVVSGLVFGGSVAGRLTLEATYAFRADYIVSASVVGVVGFFPINVAVSDTVRSEGTYHVVGDTALVLSQNTTPVLRDTLEYTVRADSLHLIQRVPLGDYAELVEALVPAGSSPPLAVLSMGRVGDPGEPMGAITADFDGNGVGDFPDFLQFVSHYGTRSADSRYDARYDLTGSGEVGFTDFLEFARQFGHRA